MNYIPQAAPGTIMNLVSQRRYTYLTAFINFRSHSPSHSVRKTPFVIESVLPLTSITSLSLSDPRFPHQAYPHFLTETVPSSTPIPHHPPGPTLLPLHFSEKPSLISHPYLTVPEPPPSVPAFPHQSPLSPRGEHPHLPSNVGNHSRLPPSRSNLPLGNPPHV